MCNLGCLWCHSQGSETSKFAVFLPKPFPHTFKVITCIINPILRGWIQHGRRQSTLLCSVLQSSGFWLVPEGWHQSRMPLDVGCCLAAQTRPAAPGKIWLSPCLLTTDILADCYRFTSANPKQVIGSSQKDYQGENSNQKGLQWSICRCCSPASTKPTVSCGQDLGFLFAK